MRNVFVIGAQSTGKTTIVNELEKIIAEPRDPFPKTQRRQEPTIIREVARNVLETHGFTRDDITDSPDRSLQLQRHIMKAQYDAEMAATYKSRDAWFIADRSGIDPIVYAFMFVGEAAAEELLASADWHDLEQHMKDGIVCLCEAGTSWLVDDGTRLMPANEQAWMRVDSTFRQLLAARGIPYLVVPRHLEKLDARVNLIIEALMAKEMDPVF